MAVLLPALIASFTNFGIGPATVYHVAQGRYPRQEILGNNIVFALVISAVGMLCGLIVVLFLKQDFFPGVARGYLLLSLALIPVKLFFIYLENILLGAKRFKEYNFIAILHTTIFLFFIIVSLWTLKAGVKGAIFAITFAMFFTDTILFFWVRKTTGGISFKPNFSYFKHALTYGVKAHIANILAFLNFRLDMFLVNGFLDPAAVGFYSISVGLAEKLWLISKAAGTVLLPTVAGELDEHRRKEFTPLVARTVFWITSLLAGGLFFVSHYIIVLLYSEAFLPTVRPIQILLLGIVALSVWRLLANDLSGRGRPVLNTYITGIAVVVNVGLNILWIPKYRIEGAAWASVTSYWTALVIVLIVYCRLTGNSWIKVFIPQLGDWALYLRTGNALGQWMKQKVKVF